jgi:phosphoribosyl-ATP pyrophosphohydrolase/phosphoribosyl-AMP cyclohydrolase
MPTLPIKFDAQGLVPAIVQDRITGEIRMFAYATEAAVRKTVETGHATFWSRSRGELWQKGRVSGQLTPVQRVLADCDADCLIYSSDPQSPSCHSGAPSCFFQAIESGGERLGQASEQPQTVLTALEAASLVRAGEGSETTATSAHGAATGVRGTAGRFADALEKESDERVVLEAASTLYQLVLGLRSRSIALRRVLSELGRRLGDLADS